MDEERINNNVNEEETTPETEAEVEAKTETPEGDAVRRTEAEIIEEKFRSGKSKKNKSCCVCCLVVLLVLFLGIVGSVFYLIKSLPGLNELIVCRTHLEKVSGAMERYHDANDKYPESLRELKGEYIRDHSLLKCPVHSGEYEYKPGKKDDDPVISCKHSLSDKLPVFGWILYRDGSVEMGVENKDGELIQSKDAKEEDVKLPPSAEKKPEPAKTDKK